MVLKMTVINYAIQCAALASHARWFPLAAAQRTQWASDLILCTQWPSFFYWRLRFPRAARTKPDSRPPSHSIDFFNMRTAETTCWRIKTAAIGHRESEKVPLVTLAHITLRDVDRFSKLFHPGTRGLITLEGCGSPTYPISDVCEFKCHAVIMPAKWLSYYI